MVYLVCIWVKTDTGRFMGKVWWVLGTCLLTAAAVRAGSVRGRVVDGRTKAPLEWVKVIVVGESETVALTDREGGFSVSGLRRGTSCSAVFLRPGYLPADEVFVMADSVCDLGTVRLVRQDSGRFAFPGAEAVPRLEPEGSEIVVSESEGVERSEYYEPLAAYGDLFSRLTAYNFSVFRYKQRGYGNRYNTVRFGGADMGDPVGGGVMWSVFGGLNDIARERTGTVGLAASGPGIGGIGGVQCTDISPLNHTPRVKVSYAWSNRSYRHRVLFTAATGATRKGWAFTVSGSGRRGPDGYVRGAYYDAWALYAGMGKRWSERHSLWLAVMYAPQEKGMASAVTKETADLAGSRYYNAYWGPDGGRDRNVRVRRYRQPMAILNHSLGLGEGVLLSTALAGRFGKTAYGALAWTDTDNPFPDYYKHLPSYLYDFDEREALTAAWRDDPSVRQIGWEKLRTANRAHVTTVRNAWRNGRRADVTGALSEYMVENRMTDCRDLFLSSSVRFRTGGTEAEAGAELRLVRERHYKEVADLLGGDFWLDRDPYLDEAPQNNLHCPDRLVGKGERFGYDYDALYRKGAVWGSAVVTKGAFRGYMGAELGYAAFRRRGRYEKESFPGSLSYGKSAVADFVTYVFKAGGECVFSPKSRLECYAALLRLAPDFRNAFVSPEHWNRPVPGLKAERVSSCEVNYRYGSPSLNVKATAYAALFRERTRVTRMYDDVNFVYSDIVLQGMDETHLGIELAAEYKVDNRLSLLGAVALGRYRYASAPRMEQFSDDDGSVVGDGRGMVYWKDFRVAGSPQTVATAGFNYSGRRYWFLQLSCNLAADAYISMNPLRRTQKVFNYLRGRDERAEMTRQEKFPAAFTLDLFTGKSFRLGNGSLVSLTASVNNLLDDRGILTGGYEQNRFRRPKREDGKTTLVPFDSKYYYAPGINFFLMLSYSF